MNAVDVIADEYRETHRPIAPHVIAFVDSVIDLSEKNHQLSKSKATIQPPKSSMLVTNAITTAGDVIDALAYCFEHTGGKSRMPLSLKRGLRKALSGISEDELIKTRNYRRGKVTLIYAFRILHPKMREGFPTTWRL